MKTNEIIDAIAVVDAKRDAGEIDEDVWRNTLESLDGEIEDKLDAMEHVMEGYENDLAVLQKEEERLKEVVKNKKATESRIKSLKGFMAYFLDQAGKKKVTTDNHIYSVRNLKASVEINDDLPDEYIVEHTKVERKPDKNRLYKELKAGAEIPGAWLKPNRKAVIK
ncbi:siphovirus Gp157 family protein [Limosilactobacillus mucosae]|uniref:siphovirus Gp157 family protein n=1 Tax=Limosilactobacillus mucosae TaxID=97478 RepID=UPI003EB9276C